MPDREFEICLGWWQRWWQRWWAGRAMMVMLAASG